MNIVELKIENIKRITALTLKVEGQAVVVVGGLNGQGKSSTLDAIWYALGGKDSLPDVPLRVGALEGSVTLDLGDLIVQRTFTERDSYLKVTGRDGSRFLTPQAILDKLLGDLSFDPLGFTRMESSTQLKVVRQLAGLDFTDQDNRRRGLFDQRTLANRRVRDLQAQLAGQPFDGRVPAAEIATHDIVQKINEAINIQRAQQDLLSQLRRVQESMESKRQSIETLRNQIVQLRHQIEQVEGRVQDEETRYANMVVQAQTLEGEAAAIKVPDVTKIQQDMQDADAINKVVRGNLQHRDTHAKLAQEQAEAARLTEALDQVDREKAQRLAQAHFPIAGLSFNELGVTFNDLPFRQASSAEQLKVSMAMALALNPKLKIILIRDGSLLDPTNLKYIAEVAHQQGAQVWIEKVTDQQSECTVLIEDGAIK